MCPSTFQSVARWSGLWIHPPALNTFMPEAQPAPAMLHLTNGDATAALVRDAGLPGEAFSVDDILMEGPLRGGLRSPADWLFRATWLQEHAGIPKADYLANFARRERVLRMAGKHDEVVVWTEDDLFCQTNLADLLARLDAARPSARLSLVCPPGERLGTVAPTRYAALFEARIPLASARLALGTAAWAALSSPDPRDVERLAASDCAAWPTLSEGLRQHLRRFPSVTGGLGAIEAGLVGILADRPLPFPKLFERVARGEPLRAYGMGDVQAHMRLRELAAGEAPLVFVDDPRGLEDAASEGAWALTERGRAVHEGRADAVAERGVDAWIGGTRLEGRGPVWRWDEAAGRLVMA